MSVADGFVYRAFDAIDSTNKEAIRQIESGASSGFWITAKIQTQGRGRRGREWVSEQGNLYSSLIYDTKHDVYQSSQLSFVTALAVRDTIAEFVVEEKDIKCKWPNDVVVDQKKISGILLESVSAKNGTPDLMVIGIGININHHPELSSYNATHLNEHNDVLYNPMDVFFILTQKMAYWLNVWQEQGFTEIRKKWISHAIGMGKIIAVRLPNEELEGRFVDLNSDGALKLEIDTNDGLNEVRLIHSGEVFFNIPNE